MTKSKGKKSLYERAEWLGSRLDTEWAEANEQWYTAFENALETLYTTGEITAEEYNELGLIAFYDFEMKEEKNMKKAYFIEAQEHYNHKTNELEYTDYVYAYRGEQYCVTALPGDDAHILQQKKVDAEAFIDRMIDTWLHPEKLILNKRKDQGVKYGVQHYRGGE